MALLTEEDKKYRTPEDICAHVGDEYAKYQGAIVPPIYQNSLFVQPTDSNGIAPGGYAYTRVSNPTIDIAERKIAALEFADGALCFSSGMGAMSSAIMYSVHSGSHVVMVDTAYGSTVDFVQNYLGSKFGVECTLVRGDSVDEIRAAIRPNTSLIYLESPSSLVFRMQDLEAVAELARPRGILTAIDNTYATPIYQQPIKHGIDIVCHTASKYMGGHSDIVAGALAARRDIIEQIQSRERLMLGNNMDPHQAWLLIRGLRTLPVRLKQHGENARKVAQFLEGHAKVKKVYYPGSATYDQPELFKKYMTGMNGLMSFEPYGTVEQGRKVINALHRFQHGCSWGGFESLCTFVGGDGVTRPKDLIRIHVGLESVDSLIEDLDQALNTAID